jgi:class 3 adenylate cyclase
VAHSDAADPDRVLDLCEFMAFAETSEPEGMIQVLPCPVSETPGPDRFTLADCGSGRPATLNGGPEEYVAFHHWPRADSRTVPEAIELACFERAVLEGDVLTVSVLFADLRGFTGVAEQLTPRRTASLLNAYLTAMVDVILARHGMIQDFVGDGILAVFGAPVRDPDHAWHAAVSAVEMQAALRYLERRSELDGQIGPAMGVAVHSGEVFAGTVGSRRRSKYAAVGDTVNVASRLEELNRALGTSIVLSGQTIALLRNRVEARRRGWFPVRGRNHAIELFELLALRYSA